MFPIVGMKKIFERNSRFSPALNFKDFYVQLPLYEDGTCNAAPRFLSCHSNQHPMNTSTFPVIPDEELLKLKKASIIFRALNHPLRQQILRLLHQHGRLRVTELFIKLRLEQPVVSQHLGLLRNAGLVQADKQGKFVFYSVNYARLKQLEELASQLVNTQNT